MQLEGLDSAAYQTDLAHLLLKKISIPAVRGDITTSDGTMLAMTVQTYTVFADPVLIPVKSRPAAATKLARLLGLTASAVMTMLDHPSSPQYQVLASEVTVTTASKIRQLQLPGIDMTTSYTTEYPNAELASDVVGFTSNPAGGGSLFGAQGLENEYNPLLAGRAGSEEVEVGANNEPIPLTEVNLMPAVPARSLRLTIQADIQYEADQVCKQRVAQTHARNCSIIVMDPKTGAILAMAQWPAYNPDDPVPYASTTNIATANVFAPGSTLKPVTVAAALEQGGQTPQSAYTIPYQITMDGRYTFHDAELHPTVRYTIAGILAHSSNVGMVQVAQHITPQQQYDYLRAFGLGSGSGLGITGESAGLLPSPGSAGYWADNRYEYAFGQGVGVTAIQMASIYATIANGGVRVQPTLVGRHHQLGRYVHRGAAAGCPPCHQGTDCARADDDAPAGTRGGRAGGRVLGTDQRLHRRGQDRHGPGLGVGPGHVPLSVWFQLHRHRAGRQPATGRGRQHSGSARQVLRRPGRRAGLLRGHEVRPADHADRTGLRQDALYQAHSAVMGGNLCPCQRPSAQMTFVRAR